MNYSGKNVLVVGMARSGLAASKLLCSLGAKVTVYDAKEEDQLKPELVDGINVLKVKKILGGDPLRAAKKCDVLLMSPGVPPILDFIVQARRTGKYIISEMELGFQFTKGEFIAVTGTNGKTTTVTLLGEIMKHAGKNTHVVGNIGDPITEGVLLTKERDVTVAEVSSYQLDETDTFKPHIAAVLNITPDHLNRYGTMENYVASKAQIYKNIRAEDYLILNGDDPILKPFAENTCAQVVYFSHEFQPEFGACTRGDDVVFRRGGMEKYICNKNDISIKGEHNLENALAAVCAASLAGVSAIDIRETLESFQGVEHRLEFVAVVNGITYINDSKGTNPDSTIRAIKAMSAPTVLILGGYDKGGEFSELFSQFTSNIVGVVAIGATKNKILDAAQICGYQNIITADSFEDALLKATELSLSGMNVLLSPACASFDMFEDYEQRGRVFKQLVRKLADEQNH